MPHFKYRAIDASGKRVQGSVDARNKSAALRQVNTKGLRSVSLTPAKKGGLGMELTLGKGKLKRKDMVVFTRQLATMVNAGVPLTKSLNSLLEQTESPRLKKEIATVAKDVESGVGFGDALAKHPDTFNGIYVNMVRAGEAAGILDQILLKLAVQQEKDASIRAKVKSAATYPSILLFITFGAFMGLTMFVVPRLADILVDLGGEDAELPVITEVLLTVGNTFKSNFLIMIVLGVAGIFAFRRWHKTKNGKLAVDKMLLKVPILKTVIAKVAVARFARIFASLMGAGVSVLEALEVTSRALNNGVFEKALAEAASELKNGTPLSVPISDNDLFPPIVGQMIAIGEETGETESVLIKVADFYEEEVDTLVASMSSIIEPIMIILLGGMVALIAGSVIGPISSFTTNI